MTPARSRSFDALSFGLSGLVVASILWLATLWLATIGPAAADAPRPLRVDESGAGEVAEVAIAVDEDGLALVVWTEEVSASRSDLLGRWVSEDAPLGGAFTIHETVGRHTRPQAYVTEVGDFQVAWIDGDDTLRWRRLDPEAPAGPERSVIFTQVPIETAIGDGGDVFVVLEDAATRTWSGQRFAENATPLGPPFTILTLAEDEGFAVAWNAALGDDESVVAWIRRRPIEELDPTNVATSTRLELQRFDLSGAPLDGPVLVESGFLQSIPPNGGTELLDLDLALGGLSEALVAWDVYTVADKLADEWYTGAFRSFDALDVETGEGDAEVMAFQPIEMTVAGGRDSSFALAWTAARRVTESIGLVARRELGAVSEGGQPFALTSDTSRGGKDVALGGAPDIDGAAWISTRCDDDPGPCVLYRRLVDTLFFSDGFEDGDLSAWSSTAGVP